MSLVVFAGFLMLLKFGWCASQIHQFEDGKFTVIIAADCSCECSFLSAKMLSRLCFKLILILGVKNWFNLMLLTLKKCSLDIKSKSILGLEGF